jgi:hypothetical protein
MMKMGGKWIQSAIKKPGALTKQAKAAGMSVSEFAQNVLSNKDDYSKTTVKRANLSKTLSKMKKGQKGMEFSNPMGADSPVMDMESESVAVSPSPNMVMQGSSPLVGSEFEIEPAISALDPNLDFARKDILSLEKQAERDNVRSYQRMLNRKYGASLSEDGAWGPKTQAAYEKFILNKSKPQDTPRATSPTPSREPNPRTKNPEKELPNFERMGEVSIKAPKRTQAPTLLPTSPIPQRQPRLSDYLNNNKPALNTRSYSDNTKVVPTIKPLEQAAKAKQNKAPIQIPNSFPKKETAVTDNRQLPETGVVVDRGTNEAFVFGKDKNFKMPVLTGLNRNISADDNTFTMEQLNTNKSGRVTPTGYYTFDENNVSDSEKKQYNNNIRELNPIDAFGISKPKATNIAMHQTYDPAYREQFYNKAANQRGKTYGCINGRCGDIATLLSQVADKDTVMVIDSRRPKDRQFLNQAKQRITKNK